MDDEILRLECLKLAGGDTAKAMKLFEFCKNRGEFSAMKGVARAAPVLENKHVKVVGKDSDLGKFTDYVKDEE